MTTTLDVDSVIERLLSVRGQPNNRTVQLAEGEIRALCAAARCVTCARRPRSRDASAGSRSGDARASARRRRAGRANAHGRGEYRAMDGDRAGGEDASTVTLAGDGPDPLGERASERASERRERDD